MMVLKSIALNIFITSLLFIRKQSNLKYNSNIALKIQKRKQVKTSVTKILQTKIKPRWPRLLASNKSCLLTLILRTGVQVQLSAASVCVCKLVRFRMCKLSEVEQARSQSWLDGLIRLYPCIHIQEIVCICIRPGKSRTSRTNTRLFRVASWLETKAIQCSLKYCIDPEVHKTKEENEAIAVEGAIWPKL